MNNAVNTDTLIARLKTCVVGQAGELPLYHALVHFRKQLPDELGVGFHKSLRQIDVIRDEDGIPQAHADMLLWHLISNSKVYWRIYEEIAESNN